MTCEVCPPEAKCPGPKFESVPDDVRGHFDATDGAHPAWWRGHDYGIASTARDIFETLADPTRVMRQAGEHTLPYHLARVRVATMAINEGCLREELKAVTDSRDDWHRVADQRAGEIVRLDRELAEAKRALAVFAERERREGRT